jgi:hypothetical protein
MTGAVLSGARRAPLARRAPRRVVRAAICGLLAATPLVWHAAPAQSAGPQPALNSERIEKRFGSYGIDVLENDERIRVSSLYSGAGADKTTRTFAIVSYPQRLAPALEAAHRSIVAGGSIGAVFKADGWQVTKTHDYFGQLAATDKLASLMRISEGTRLAVDVYVLHVAKRGRTYDYATIVEIHHPNYLRLDDLVRIYNGGRPPPAPDARVREVLAVVADKIG